MTPLVYSNHSLLQQISYSNLMHNPLVGRADLILDCIVEHARHTDGLVDSILKDGLSVQFRLGSNMKSFCLSPPICGIFTHMCHDVQLAPVFRRKQSGDFQHTSTERVSWVPFRPQGARLKWDLPVCVLWNTEPGSRRVCVVRQQGPVPSLLTTIPPEPSSTSKEDTETLKLWTLKANLPCKLYQRTELSVTWRCYRMECPA